MVLRGLAGSVIDIEAETVSKMWTLMFNLSKKINYISAWAVDTLSETTVETEMLVAIHQTF